LIGEALGLGGVQVLVGVGMGAGLGLLQGRALRGVLHSFAPWFWSCVVGLGAPFLAWDIAQAAGWEFSYSLYVCVTLGGLIAGIWQAFLLRQRWRGTGWWIVGSVAGWTLAAGMAMAADALSRSRALRGLAGALTYLGMVAGGGLILGLVTGLVLVWLHRREPTVEDAHSGS
jgi:NhaP-type Na+/H+ or K+/H+ antiporter